jgi:hypothetical protein
MMTEEDIKEELSKAFVQLIASRRGYTYSKSEKDYGVDMTIAEVQAVQRAVGSSSKRYFETGRHLQLQLKCTCDASVEISEQQVKYELKVANYNDLARRWRTIPSTPLYLVLFVLPDDRDEWLHVSDAELRLQRFGYWYAPPVGTPESQNSQSVTISIPRANRIDLSFVGERLREHYQ